MQSIKLKEGHLLIFKDDIEGKLKNLDYNLLQIAEKTKNWGIISPLVLSQKGQILNTGGFLSPKVAMPVYYGLGESYVRQYPGSRTVEITQFFCALIHKDLLKKQPIDLKDDYNQFKSADYCLTASKNGFIILQTDKESVTYNQTQLVEEELTKKEDEFYKLQKDFQAKWKNENNKKYRLPVAYNSRLQGNNGFQVALSNYMRFLSRAKIDLQYTYLLDDPVVEGGFADAELGAITDESVDLAYPQIIWAQAPYFYKNSGKYKIGHCEFEGFEFPEQWVHPCNQMDEIWVPTMWDREKARKAGVNKPIYIIHQGIDPDYFHPNIEPMQFNTPKRFKFIVNAAWLDRKNLKNLIKTFCAEFGPYEDVCLLIHTRNVMPNTNIKEEIKALNIPVSGGSAVFFEDNWETEKNASFYTAGNCFVLPTHGEGWGLPIFEALACGVPTITTAFGAPNEMLRDSTEKKLPLPGLHLLNYQKVRSRDRYEYLMSNFWAEPDLVQLARKMRYVYEHYKEEKAKALETSKIIRQKFAWSECVKPIIKRLEAIYKKGF